MAFTAVGFSVIAWVRSDSALIRNLDEPAAERVSRQLLIDFNTLLGCRWNMELSIHTIGNRLYAYGANNRFSVSDRTIRNAIGTLTEHIDILRGSHTTSVEDLVHYKACKEKWQVPETVTESSSGWVEPEPAGTSHITKRRRF